MITTDELSVRPDHSEQVNVTAIWVKGSQETPIASQQVSFSRAIRTILSIDMDKVGKVESGMQLSIDNSQMQDGDIVEL